MVEAHVNGVNSDVVLIAHLDATNHSVSLLSIPRDTFVPGARSGNTLCGRTWSYTPGLCANKIDSALVEGPDQLAQAIEQDFGIPINHIVDLNFATFEDLVNALGGLWMYFPDKLVDASAGLYIDHTGCIHLSGTRSSCIRAGAPPLLLHFQTDPESRRYQGRKHSEWSVVHA